MGIREDLRIPLTMLSLSFLNTGTPYKGSYNGKRFLFKKENEVLKVLVWKDLFCFEKTDEKDITIKEFEYSKDGIEKGLDYIENFTFIS